MRRLGIPLIEDAAHALETEIERRPVGSFGAASVFSLSKHFPGRGGVLSLDHEISRPEAARLQGELMVRKPLSRRATGSRDRAARTSLDALQSQRNGGSRAAGNAAGQAQSVASASASASAQACCLGIDLDEFDEWMETAYPDYRMRQGSSDLKRTLAGLRDLERDREERIAGVLRLRELDSVAPAACRGRPLPLLRVPLLIEDRDAVAIELRRRRINVYFVYALHWTSIPGRSSQSRRRLPEAARWWGAHVLPVDPHDAERVLELLARNQIRLTAAVPPLD